MRFLVDVNARGYLASWLTEIGHDVALVSDMDPRMTDDDVLTWAVRERRIVVTTDKDFEEMIWRQGRHHSGVLRLENLPRSARRVLLEDALTKHSQDLEAGAIVIAMRSRTRIRQPAAK